MRVFKDLQARRSAAWFVAATGLALAHAVSAAPGPQEANPAYDAQDARLNAAYKTLSQSLDDAGRKALRAEERQWIVGRDTSCKVSAGTIVKNQCTTTQTSFRADELEKRVASNAKAASAGGAAALAGDWAYRSDCNFGHDAEVSVTKTSPEVEGTWSDGTRTGGSQGRFKGEWRDSKLYVRFCAEDSDDKGFSACPAYGDAGDYMVAEGSKLAWYHAVGAPSENKFSKYLVLSRKPKGGDVPKDMKCKDAG